MGLMMMMMMMIMIMVCVRGWVFAGKVSPQFVQLAYKVPVSGSCDHQVIENCTAIGKREQTGVLWRGHAGYRGKMVLAKEIKSHWGQWTHHLIPPMQTVIGKNQSGRRFIAGTLHLISFMSYTRNSSAKEETAAGTSQEEMYRCLKWTIWQPRESNTECRRLIIVLNLSLVRLELYGCVTVEHAAQGGWQKIRAEVVSIWCTQWWATFHVPFFS